MARRSLCPNSNCGDKEQHDIGSQCPTCGSLVVKLGFRETLTIFNAKSRLPATTMDGKQGEPLDRAKSAASETSMHGAGNPSSESIDQILNASLSNPLEGTLTLEDDEKVRFQSKALSITGDSFRIGHFVLTNKRLVFHSEDLHNERILASVRGVTVDYDYLTGLVSLGLPEVTKGWVHLMLISTAQDSTDSFSFIPDSEDLILIVAKAISKMAGVESDTGKPPEPT